MATNSDRTHRFRPAPLMMVYQFVFFTLYQIIETISFDRFIAFKAATLVGALQMCLLVVLFDVAELFTHASYWPPFAEWGAVAVLTSMVTYFAVYEHGPWKEYGEHFRQWSRGKLIIGRLCVLLGVAGLLVIMTLLRSR